MIRAAFVLMGEVDVMGRPLKFRTVEELQEKIDAYFESCWEEVPVMTSRGTYLTRKNPETGEKELVTIRRQVRPYTITGLAIALDTTRQTLLNYEERDEFLDTIKKAKSRCEQYAEERLFSPGNPAGAIFNLVNNYEGWSNKQETRTELQANGGFEVKINLIESNQTGDAAAGGTD